MAIAKDLVNASKSMSVASSGEAAKLNSHIGHGPDPRMNPRLATVVAAAKKIGTPKATIEKSIAIGQGISLSGATLENVMVEAMIPPSVALIIECQTDSKKRTFENLRYIIHKAGGSVTPTNHLFERKGRIVFEKSNEIGEVEAIDLAIEAGALDVNVSLEDGNEELIVLTEPTGLTEIANALAQSSGLEFKSSDIIWDPKEDLIFNVRSSEGLDDLVGKYHACSKAAQMKRLTFSLERIYEEATVQEVHTNAR